MKGLDLLDHIENMAKVGIEPININQQETNKATSYHWATPWGPLTGLQVKHGSVIPSHCEGHISPGKLKKNLVSVVKYYTAVDYRINMEDESKIPIENKKPILADFYK